MLGTEPADLPQRFAGMLEVLDSTLTWRFTSLGPGASPLLDVGTASTAGTESC
jgi:hypothetical protein